MAQETNPIGVTINGRYLIERKLGQGGFGAVYLARDKQLVLKPVVVKILLEASRQDEWAQRKFKQEMEALARLDHPHIVNVLDAGVSPDGKPFLVMQYVEGISLRAALKTEGIELKRVASLMQQIGRALNAAHDKGILHRDLKPENIMLQTLDGGEEQVKIIDFGIAKIKDSLLAPETTAAAVVGTILYMAPEQLSAQPISAASDIYALGIIAYEMVTGHRPFNPDSSFQLLEMQRNGVRLKPADIRPDLPAAAQDVILKALSFDPRDRYLRARDFGDELAKALTISPMTSNVAAQGESKTPRDNLANNKLAPSTKLDADPASDQSHTLELAHVLFSDLVGYSKLSIDKQTELRQQLMLVVRGTNEFNRAQESNELISRSTGDGMALVFFGDPMSPVKCALEIAQALHNHPEIKLRMGIHTGPIYRDLDINDQIDVTGGGINFAQRVMDCGDDGHILLSKSVADVLSQLDKWASHIHDLGEVTVKHDVRVHVFNLYMDELGNPEPPEKLRPARRLKRLLNPALITIATISLLFIVCTVIWYGYMHMASSPPQADDTVVPLPTTERALTYWLNVQKMRDGKPYEEPFASSGQEIFENGWQFRLNISSQQSGYLYIISETQTSANGMPQYTVLSPFDGGSALLAAREQIAIPPQAAPHGFFLEKQKGTEKLWIVWSAQPVTALEAVRGLANPRDRGIISDPTQINEVREAFTKYMTPAPEKMLNGDQTNIHAKGDVLVHLLELKHH